MSFGECSPTHLWLEPTLARLQMETVLSGYRYNIVADDTIYVHNNFGYMHTIIAGLTGQDGFI